MTDRRWTWVWRAARRREETAVGREAAVRGGAEAGTTGVWEGAGQTTTAGGVEKQERSRS